MAWLKAAGREVIYDAEHFFDGFAANPEYALATLRAAEEGGADMIVLCDTNGGSLTRHVEECIRQVQEHAGLPLGIHAHNDSELAVANSLAAVACGAVQVQGTINGYGERCGNANLCSVIPNLELKMDHTTIGRDRLSDCSPRCRGSSARSPICRTGRNCRTWGQAPSHTKAAST